MRTPSYGHEELKDIDPFAPTDAVPGTEEKVKVIAARYRAAAPLWHPEDSDKPAIHPLQKRRKLLGIPTDIPEIEEDDDDFL